MVKVSKKNLIVPELEKKEKASVNVEGDAASSDSEDEQVLCVRVFIFIEPTFYH